MWRCGGVSYAGGGVRDGCDTRSRLYNSTMAGLRVRKPTLLLERHSKRPLRVRKFQSDAFVFIIIVVGFIFGMKLLLAAAAALLYLAWLSDVRNIDIADVAPFFVPVQTVRSFPCRKAWYALSTKNTATQHHTVWPNQHPTTSRWGASPTSQSGGYGEDGWELGESDSNLWKIYLPVGDHRFRFVQAPCKHCCC